MMLANAGYFGLIAVAATAVAAMMLIVASGLMFDGFRAKRRIELLEAEIERQNDIVWDLRESEERTRSLIDGQGDLIVRRDARGRIAFVNEAYAALAGREREDLLGSDFRFTVSEAGAREQRDGAVVRRDEAVDTADGVRWIEWQDVAVRGSALGRP